MNTKEMSRISRNIWMIKGSVFDWGWLVCHYWEYLILQTQRLIFWKNLNRGWIEMQKKQE